MKKIFAMIIILFLMFLGDMISSKEDSFYRIVTSSGLVLRTKPSKDSEPITVILKDRIVKIISTTNIKETIEGKTAFWVKIITLENEEGFVFGGYLSNPTISREKTFYKSSFYDMFKAYKHNDKAVENALLKKFNKYFIRKGNVLSINLLNSRKLELKDTNDVSMDMYDGENGEVYILIGYLEDIKYVVVSHYRGGEYGDYKLINLVNGECIIIDSKEIQLSPDKKRLLVLAVQDGPYGLYLLEIINVEGEKPYKEFKYITKPHGEYKIKYDRHIHWVLDNKIEIINEIKFQNNYIRSVSELTYSSSKWKYIP